MYILISLRWAASTACYAHLRVRDDDVRARGGIHLPLVACHTYISYRGAVPHPSPLLLKGDVLILIVNLLLTALYYVCCSTVRSLFYSGRRHLLIRGCRHGNAGAGARGDAAIWGRKLGTAADRTADGYDVSLQKAAVSLFICC